MSNRGNRRRGWVSVEVGILAVGIVSIIVAVGVGAPRGDAADRAGGSRAPAADSDSSTSPDVDPQSATVSADAEPFEMPDCPDPSDSASPGIDVGHPEAREAAQKGLDYLAAEAVAWQKRANCYGCHVQAVTVEAFSIGAHHQYTIDGDAFDAVVDGMLDKKGGAHKKGGFGHFKRDIARTAKVLGAAAFARYDQWVDTRVSEELVAEAERLREMQNDDGSLDIEWGPRPVVVGAVQFAAQAIVTWKQAYDRTADDVWLTAVQRSEEYLQNVVAGWGATEPYMQEVSYAIIGLLAAGVHGTEDTMEDLKRRLLAQQRPDGSWTYGPGEKRASEAFATGQTLYALRLLGMTDADAPIANGTAWLIGQQRSGGSWSDHGFDKAEAMWAVLGLVSIDVLTVDVDGVRDGMHVSGVVPLAATARDNRGGGVRTVEVRVDDVAVFGQCGSMLSFEWDTADLANGKHIVDVIATNAHDEESRRRFQVYAGSIYFTQIGTEYDAGSTVVSLRNVAPSSMGNDVTVEIYSTVDSSGAPTPHALVRTLRQRGTQGAMQFRWDGADENGNAVGSASYIARVTLTDDAGVIVQSEDVAFFHDTLAAQNEQFGQVQGQLRFAQPATAAGATTAGDGAIDTKPSPDPEPAANTVVELWDDAEGEVVSTTTSTPMGNYRFKNVEPGKKYRVRVKKKGYREEAGEVSVEKGLDNPYVDMDLIAE